MTHDLTIRRATAADGEALERLAVFACEPPLHGDVLLLEVGGEPWAACSLASGRTIGDAFRRTLKLRSLLRDFAFA
jgi:hypothetical protein